MLNEIIKVEMAVVLVNFNDEEDTRSCLKSILEHEESPPFAVIVDNSTPKNTSLDEFKSWYKNLHIIYSEKNIGFGMANNTGIEWIKSNLDFQYITLLNNDTITTNGALSKLTATLNSDPEIGIATGKIMYLDDPTLVWYGGGDINLVKGWPEISDMNSTPTKTGANQSRYVTFISGCLMVFSKESILALKGFDPLFFMYCEDLELCLRATKSKFKLFYNSESIIYHKVQGSFHGSKDRKEKGLRPQNPNVHFLFFHMLSNQYITMRKQLSSGAFFRFRFYYWMKFIYLNLWMIFNGKFSILKTSVKTVKRIAQNKR
ncbi:MAG: glycosyltransferase family 2 protein [Crocinitomicaceae bacterium]|nr:glycosyltransferase family 2 protein [Crocinitomicaceae bacterium]